MKEKCPLCNQPLTEPIEVQREDNDIMVKIDGKTFRCNCGCNIFRKVKGEPNLYSCNSCDTIFYGE